MATSITNLSITKATVEVGSAATFRNTINDNFTNYKTAIETKVNNQIKVAVSELQTMLGDSWPTGTVGTISARLGGSVTKRRVIVGVVSTNETTTVIRNAALVGDLICEVNTI